MSSSNSQRRSTRRVKEAADVAEAPDPLTIRDVAAKDVTPLPLDDTDLSILRELVDDARISQRALAAKLGISAPTVGERMTRLERNGVITRYTVEIDMAAIGYPQTVHLALESVEREHVAEMMQQLADIDEIESVALITGQWDLIVKLRTRDYTHFRSVLMDKVWAIPGMTSMTTMMSIAETPPKNFAQGILAALAEQRTRGTEETG